MFHLCGLRILHDTRATTIQKAAIPAKEVPSP